MSADVLQALLEVNLAAACAIAFVLLVRKPAHHLMGSRAVYLLWAIVPIAILATFLPPRTIETVEPTMLPDRVVVTAFVAKKVIGIDWASITFAICCIAWAIGAGALAIGLARRQAVFNRDADRGTAGPAVVGFSRPRIVTPDDFAERFSHDERKLILAHEQVHLERNDSRINALAALVRCVCWFNPLVHIGAGAMRVDQELACDAEVIERRPKGRRAYAEMLLKTQLVAQPLPVGCYWPPESPHPLTERIAMLARTPVSRKRRTAATIAVLVLAASGGVAAWAAQPERAIFRQAADVYVPFRPLGREPSAGQPAGMQPVMFNTDATNPRLGADFVKPAYPATSQALREEGDVTVEMCVAASGEVESAKLVRSSGHQRLDDVTVSNLLASRLEPATRDGEAVRVCGYMLTVSWNLEAFMEADTNTVSPP
jgi:TonB family protein